MLHLGSCVDNSRILTVLTQVATEGGLGEDIDDLPAVGLCPEWMSEKALAIGTYFAASGAYVIFGVGSPVRASSEVTRLMTERLGEPGRRRPRVRARLAEDAGALARAHRRQARGAQAARPTTRTQFGASGDSPYFAAIRAYLAEHDTVETVGSAAYALSDGVARARPRPMAADDARLTTTATTREA